MRDEIKDFGTAINNNIEFSFYMNNIVFVRMQEMNFAIPVMFHFKKYDNARTRGILSVR